MPHLHLGPTHAAPVSEPSSIPTPSPAGHHAHRRRLSPTPPDPARRHRRRGGARRRRWPEARTEARPTRATPSPTTSAGTPSSARASAPPCGTYLPTPPRSPFSRLLRHPPMLLAPPVAAAPRPSCPTSAPPAEPSRFVA
jgi:hypothetical protein